MTRCTTSIRAAVAHVAVVVSVLCDVVLTSEIVVVEVALPVGAAGAEHKEKSDHGHRPEKSEAAARNLDSSLQCRGGEP
eukprot:9495727-Pyramimonas_sp.AAC.1